MVLLRIQKLKRRPKAIALGKNGSMENYEYYRRFWLRGGIFERWCMKIGCGCKSSVHIKYILPVRTNVNALASGEPRWTSLAFRLQNAKFNLPAHTYLTTKVIFVFPNILCKLRSSIIAQVFSSFELTLGVKRCSDEKFLERTPFKDHYHLVNFS